ncbi:MAG TPA: J domain-containing protein [Paracoccaceae bacterium]|nr:J domain-containing protein [Paracoccaceae bacterium]
MLVRLLLLAGAICVGYKMFTGRWPWEKKLTTRQQAVFRARQLLGVEAGVGREDILAAHKRLVAMVHPDRGGTNDQVHEANAARDLLIDELPGRLGS